ncbi:hypothetical protein C0993_006923, partial [Termitomyces sp. T159_Od127]
MEILTKLLLNNEESVPVRRFDFELRKSYEDNCLDSDPIITTLRQERRKYEFDMSIGFLVPHH